MAEFKPKSQIKNVALKNGLKCYVLPAIINTYQTASVRALISDGEELWQKRITMEKLLNGDKNIVGFFSCLTALEIVKKSKEKRTEEETEAAAQETRDIRKSNVFAGK